MVSRVILQKLKEIENWPVPEDKTDIKSFLGLVGYYRKMVPEFAELAVPLTRLTRKQAKFEWGEAAFNRLKKCLIQPPILSFPLESGGFFLLDTDASGVAIGSVLSQYQNNKEKVIAYGSHTLVGWLVGCFGFNGPLRQYFSLYRAISQREGERRERIDESKNVQTTPTRTYCKRSRPLPYCNQNCRTPRHWKFTQRHRTTRPPPPVIL